jgi:tetratricopeptide (TPR) repeat protein
MSKNKRLVKVVSLFALLLVVFAFAPNAGAQNAKTETEKWREDLRFMAQEMPKRHKDLFHRITREQFEAAIKNLDARIPNLERNQIIVEMQRIAAMIGDGHTNLYPTRDAKVGFHILPVKLYLFSDGLFIRAAKKEQADLVGARIIKIGNLTAQQAVAKAGALVGSDNEWDAKYFAPQLLVMPEILHALGMSNDTGSASFTLEKNGKQQTVLLKQIGLAEVMPGDTDMTWTAKDGWIDLRDAATDPLPLWLKNPANKFWFEMLSDKQTLYVQLNQVGGKDDESLEEFAKRLATFIESNPIEKLVLDLRLNRGGNGTLLRPLVTALIKSKINQPNKFFTVIGRSTFSAAQFLVNDLEHYTDTIFVGEPSGSKGNIYGDSRKIILPNSGITVRVSIYYWQDWHPLDSREWTAPQLTAELSSEEYRTNVDPALKLIAGYIPQKSVSELLAEAFSKNDLALAKERFKLYRAAPVNKYRDLQDELFTLTDKLLGEKKNDDAIEVLKLNIEANPRSIFAYMALGDIYAYKGDKNLAREAYEKALQLNPRNIEAQDKLKAIAPSAPF